MEPVLRRLTANDLAAVERIQREAYPHYHKEALAIFADKLAYYPAGCWAYEANRAVVGYLFSHPWRFENPPKLDTLFEAPVNETDCYFIHDKAVLPAFRGAGVGRQLIGLALAHAEAIGHATVALVAVQNARSYWERYGFQPVPQSEAVDAVRRSYGPEAHYMIRRVQ